MKFSEVIGHQETKLKLAQAVREGRISHAQLFLGAEGCGALPMALAYAQYISCTNRNESDSCGTCASCIKYQKLIHPDLHFAYPVAISKDVRVSTAVIATWREKILENPYLNLFDWFLSLDAENKQAIIGTEESAEIMRKLSLTTYEAEYKVMIIWMAEKMNSTAANKLLKILEEPPDKTLFILVCEAEDQLLPTIISRTQTTRIGKLSTEEIKNALMRTQQLSSEDAGKFAFVADGNYNEAMKHAFHATEELNYFDFFRDWMRLSFKLDIQKAMKWIESIAGIGRESQKRFLLYCNQIMRSGLLENLNMPDLVKLEGEEKEFIKKFSPYIGLHNISDFSEELTKAFTHIERNANPKILFLDLTFKMNELLNRKNS
ncbi:MAG: DNA polymerase III subunit delta [Bacteroidetes bacterium]|nr:DNA polymerase III subunit delta [Bacteroidota bacterium]